MAAPMVLPYATLTVKCKDGWKKGMGLKISDTLEMEVCDTLGEDVHAIAQDDKEDGEYGSVFVGGVVPVRVKHSAGSAGDRLRVQTDGTFDDVADTGNQPTLASKAVGQGQVAVAFDDWDHDATATTEGLVTALVQVGNFHIPGLTS